VAEEKKPTGKADASDEDPSSRVKFEVYGDAMLEKTVKMSGNSGRVYLPPSWVGHLIKIIRSNIIF